MLDKFKEINKLRKLKSEADKEVFEVEKDGVKVVLNGSLNLQKITLNPEINIIKQEKILISCFNDAIRQAQMTMAQKFQGLM